MHDIRVVPFDHPDAVRLIADLQAHYLQIYGGGDDTAVDAAEFTAPRGGFVVAYVDGDPVGCGGWRSRDGGHLRAGDAEIKRMYVAPAGRRRGVARAVLAAVERDAAAAGRVRMVLESGLRQPDALAFYAAQGYTPTAPFGHYRDSPDSRYFAKPLAEGTGVDQGQMVAPGDRTTTLWP